MSIKLTVASALQDEFPFDPAVGFLGQKPGEQPCYDCVLSLPRDIRVCCVAEDGSATRCIICANAAEKVCCAVPEQLLGAAQKIWNSYTAHVLADDWSGLQRWRIVNRFDKCISAFKRTYEVILNPFRDTPLEVIQAQECASLRQITSLEILVATGQVLTPAEARARLAAAAPAYTANCPEVIILRNQLRLIDACPDTPVPGERSNRRAFHKTFKSDLVALLGEASANGAPAPRVIDRT